MMDRRTLIRSAGAKTLSLTALGASISSKVRGGGVFNIESFGARAGDNGDMLQRARQNTAAINAAVRSAKEAGGGTVVFPGNSYTVTANALPRTGTLAQRGPVASAININDCRDINFFPRNSETRLIRLESEVTGNSYDATNSTISINNSNNIRIEGISFEGHQSADVKNFTTGDSIQINFGSQDIIVSNASFNKGTNAISIGNNIREYGSHDRGLRLPVKRIQINNVKVYNCEHAILVNVAEEVGLDHIHHQTQTYEFKGNSQASYIQRGVYLLNCRKVSISKSKFYDASKVAIFMALYPQRRAFSDLEDIEIDDVEIINKNPQLVEAGDWEIGLQIFDQNLAGMAPTRLRRLRMKNTNFDGLKTAISMQTKNDYRPTSPATTDVLFSDITGKTNRCGVMVDQISSFENFSLIKSSFEVDTEVKDRNKIGISVNGVGRNEWNPRSGNLTLQDLKVRSQVPAVVIGPVQGVRIDHCSFSDEGTSPSRQQENLRLQGTRNVVMDGVEI